MFPFLIFIIAFTVRYIFITYSPQSLCEGAGARYDVVAKNINRGYGISHFKDHPTIYFGPVYLYFLAFVYRFLGEEDEFRYAQGVIDSFACTILYFIGKELFSIEVGILSGMLAALYPTFIASVGCRLMETMKRFLTTVFGFTFILMIKNPSFIKAFVCGLSLGIDILCVDVMTFFPVLGLLIYIPLYLFFDFKILALPHLGIFFIGLLIPFSSWVIRNYLIFHRIIFLTLRGGAFLAMKPEYHTNGSCEYGLTPNFYKITIEKYRKLRGEGKDAVDLNNWMTSQAIKDLIYGFIHTPIDFIIERWKKFIFFWTTPSGDLGDLPFKFKFQHNLFLLLGLIGMVWSIIKSPLSISILLILLYYSFIFIFIIPTGRYRLHIMPIFLVFVGAGIIYPANAIFQYNKILSIIIVLLLASFIIKVLIYLKIHLGEIIQKIGLIPLKFYGANGFFCYDVKKDRFWHISGDNTIINISPFWYLGDLIGCPDHLKFFVSGNYTLANPLKGKKIRNITSDGEFLYVINDHNEVWKVLIDKLPLRTTGYDNSVKNVEVDSVFRLDEEIDVSGTAFDGRNLMVFSKKDKKIYTYSIDGEKLGATDYSLPLEDVRGLAWNSGFLYAYDGILNMVSKIDVAKGEIVEFYRVPTTFGSGIATKDSMMYFSSSEGRVYQYNMEKAALNFQEIKKVLVFCSAEIEQIKYTVKSLKGLSKSVSVSMLASPGMGRQMNDFPGIDEVILYDYNSFNLLNIPFSLMKRMRREEFDLAVIPRAYLDDVDDERYFSFWFLSCIFGCKNMLKTNEKIEEEQRLAMNIIRSSLPRIRKIAKSKVKRVILFCASKFTKELLLYLKERGLQVVGIADNDSRKQTQEFAGFNVLSPKEITKERVDGVIICSYTHQDEIYKQLRNLRREGIKILKIFDV